MSGFNFDKYTHILVVDLKATCCDLKSIPRHQLEAIEIGAVMVDRHTLSIVAVIKRIGFSKIFS